MLELRNYINHVDLRIKEGRFYVANTFDTMKEVSESDFKKELLIIKEMVLESVDTWGDNGDMEILNKMLKLVNLQESEINTKKHKCNKLDIAINNIYNECNVIKNVCDDDIFDSIYNNYPKITRKKSIIIYANVCNLIFGDNIDEIIKSMEANK